MPLPAGTLLWLNRRTARVGNLRLGVAATSALALALLLFAAVLLRQLLDLAG